MSRGEGRILRPLAAGFGAVALCAVAWPVLFYPIGPLAYGLAAGASFTLGLAFLAPVFAVALGLGYALLGTTGLWIALLLVVVPLAGMRAAWTRKLRFAELAGIGILLLITGLLATYLLLARHFGDPLDAFLRTLTQNPSLMQLSGMDDLAFARIFLSAPMLDPALVDVESAEFARMVAEYGIALREGLPSKTIYVALLGGASMAYLPIAMERRRGVVLMTIRPVERWSIPAWARISLFGIFLLAWASLLTAWDGAATLFQAASMLLALCFSVQGYAAADTFCKRRGMKPGARAALLIGVFCFARIVLVVLGALDGWLLVRTPRIGAGREGTGREGESRDATEERRDGGEDTEE